MTRIGQDLRERYQAPEELPFKLLVLAMTTAIVYFQQVAVQTTEI